MLWTVVLILVALWEVGLATSTTAGGLVCLLPLVAVAVLLVSAIQGSRRVA
jgi:hypothetical protein